MKKSMGVMVVAMLCAVFAVGRAVAEDQTGPEKNLKDQIAADKAKLKEEKQVIKQHGQEARQEEKAIKSQIRDAAMAGDPQKAKELRGELKTVHQENIQQKIEDKNKIREVRKELKQEIREVKVPKVPKIPKPVVPQGPKQ